VHGVVPIEPAKRIESAIHIVNTISVILDGLAILDLIFGHGLISPRARLIGQADGSAHGATDDHLSSGASEEARSCLTHRVHEQCTI
jgi:hypothetical protein